MARGDTDLNNKWQSLMQSHTVRIVCGTTCTALSLGSLIYLAGQALLRLAIARSGWYSHRELDAQ